MADQPLIPPALRGTNWEPTIRAVAAAILVVAPALVIVRQVQRASIRGTAVQLSRTQFPDLYASADGFAAALHVTPTPAVFLGYSCDRNGAALESKGELGLVLLTAGRYAADSVHVSELVDQGRHLGGF
jgi:hypothetical protein